jgi:hypothetical protein
MDNKNRTDGGTDRCYNKELDEEAEEHPSFLMCGRGAAAGEMDDGCGKDKVHAVEEDLNALLREARSDNRGH